jgi:formylmethanofuran dehydrogenase subunit E
MSRSVEECLTECLKLHGHLCPGQVLGVRMSLLGCRLLGLDDPQGQDRKKLIVFVEIDRCMSDAVSAVTGVRLGRRSLKFLDYGKAAATFHHLEENVSFRVAVLESSRALADERFPEVSGKKERQMKAYLSAADEDLFRVERVVIALSPQDLPGAPRSRVICANCGEGVNDGRYTEGRDGEFFCRPCAGQGYFTSLPT